MKPIIASVKRENEPAERDLIVPAETPSSQLSSLIAEALNWQTDADGKAVSYQIVADPPGRVLAPNETLADAEAWDGTRLVFQRVNTHSSSPKQQEKGYKTANGSRVKILPIADNPVSGWIPLDIDLPNENTDAADEEADNAPPPKFVWKRLDK